MFDKIATEHEYEMRVSIFEAASDLLRAYSFSQLTVKDICRIAEISKPTFYRYFTDKYAIAEWAVTSYMRQPTLTTIRTSTLEQQFLSAYHHFREHRVFYRKAYAGKTAAELSELNARMLLEGYEDFIFVQCGVKRTSKLEFQLRYYVRMICSLLPDWT